jgi:nicotinamidase-related amidase
VVHCLIQRRPDGRGSNHNARLFAAAKSIPADLTPGSAGATVLPEFGPDASDLILTRTHGVGPMTGTDLDSVLRNLGIATIVGVGVSVNVAITNFAMDAVNRGYQFVLPRDAVSGFPRDYAESVIDNTLSLLTTVTTTSAVVDTWAELAA